MFNTELPKKAAVYCRVSSEAQQERQTIETQVEFAHKYCDLNGIEITTIYRDDGITGTLPMQDRPAGGQLLEDAKEGHFDLLLIFKLDRLGRSTRVILNAVHDLDGMGVLVRSMTEPFDTSDASGRFLLTILAGVADLERSNILQRMALGTDRAARDGKWLGGIVPYGYIVNDDRYLEVNETIIPGLDMSEADVVRMMYDLCLQGESTIKIAKRLNAIKVPPAWIAHGLGGKRRNNTSALWNPSRVLGILRSSTYKGIHQYGKRSQRERELIERQVPAIVDTDTWDKAQVILHNNQIDSMKNSKHKYLLRSIIKCENCGSTYRCNPGGKNKGDGYYSCNGRSNWRRMSMNEKCQGMSINMKWLDNFVWQDCLRFINNPGLVVSSIEAAEADMEADEQTAKLLADHLAELDADKERMLDLYRQKLISMDDLAKQLEKIETDRKETAEHLQELNDKTSSSQLFAAKETAVDMLELMQKTVNAPDVTFDVMQTVIRTMVEKITVATDNSGARPRARITIHYRFNADTPTDFTRTVPRTVKRADNCVGIVTTTAEYPPAPEPGTTPRERLIYLQYQHNILQPELASIAGASSATISNMVNGHNETMRPHVIKKICDHYGLPYSFLGAYDQLPEDTTADKLRKGRLYRLLRQPDAAAYFGVDTRTYNKWEQGRISNNPRAAQIDARKFAEWVSIFRE